MNQMIHQGVDAKLYQSLADVKKLSYDWSEKSDITDSVQTMAEQMTRLPKEDLLTGDYLITEPDEEKVTELFKYLTPSNMNLAFVDPNFDETPSDVIELP